MYTHLGLIVHIKKNIQNCIKIMFKTLQYYKLNYNELN